MPVMQVVRVVADAAAGLFRAMWEPGFAGVLAVWVVFGSLYALGRFFQLGGDPDSDVDSDAGP